MTATAPTSVAVLGLGAMGSRLAARLTAAGHHLTVWNRTPAKADALVADHPGIAVAASPREAAAGAGVVLSMVADDAASAGVWLDPGTGALAGVASDAVAIEASTVSGAMAGELADAAAHAGIAFLESPVVGSRPQADAGALLALVGGDPAVLERVRPVLGAYAGRIHHTGPAGTAAVMKLAINGLFAIQVAAYAEIAGLLRRSPLDTVAALDLLTALPITSPALQRIVGLIAERDFEPNFPVELVAKDLRYLGALARRFDAGVPLSRAAADVYAAGADGPERSLDIAGIAHRYL